MKSFQLIFLVSALFFSKCFSEVHNPFLNSRALPKSYNAECSKNPEEEMTTIELIRKNGYKAEEHFVTTEDGYILALHRIPGNEKSRSVLLHHSLLESSFCWVVQGVKKSLAYILADNGYDVWLANSRGNTYSKNHTVLNSSNPEFWNFSWHEMGIYDLPAEIGYITTLKNRSLLYIGHSMGSTMFFAMASNRPETASKVEAMFALAPSVYLEHMKGLLRKIETAMIHAQNESNVQVNGEFLAQNWFTKFFGKCICNKPIIRDMCRDMIDSVIGHNPEHFDTSLLPLILTHTPAGTSTKTLNHFAQGLESKNFLFYDYGKEINLRLYKNDTPPEYDLKKIKVPVSLFWSENDYLVRPEDLMRLRIALPNVISNYKVADPRFNHLDFVWADNANQLVYSQLLLQMGKYQ